VSGHSDVIKLHDLITVLSLGAPVVEKISAHFASLNKAIAAMNFGRHDFPVELL
jgi:hypothetical protein